jgi:hypothetical protein
VFIPKQRKDLPEPITLQKGEVAILKIISVISIQLLGGSLQADAADVAKRFYNT